MSDDFYYISYDLCGYPFNSEFPPNFHLYGDGNGGYKNAASQVLFYDFAVQMYDVKFRYKGKMYYLLYTPKYAALTDEKFDKEIQVYPTPNDLIKNLVIDGNKLINIIDEIEDIEPV